jgi:hypothetical protein
MKASQKINREDELIFSGLIRDDPRHPRHPRFISSSFN